MMEESQEILLNSLNSFGIEIPSEISSVGQINPTTIFSICTQSLRRLPLPITDETPSFPTSLPDSMADRVRICTDVASALTNLGFIGDISFHKFLYPSEEDLYKLVRFLVKRLSEISEASENAQSLDIHDGVNNAEDNHESTSEVCSETNMEFSGNNDLALMEKSDMEAGVVSQKINQTASLTPSLGMLCISTSSCENDGIRQPTETFRELRQSDQIEDTHGDVKDISKSVEGSTSFQELRAEEFTILEEARRKAFEGPVKVDFLQSLHVNSPDAQEKLQTLKNIELETESILSEIRKREEECVKLTTELERQPKVATRRSYVERITEITKNSRKQNADIERILKETRELQLESNSVEERLHRSYAIVDEIVLREAKKDVIGHQAYKLLTSIHNSFEEIRAKTLETDRTRREVADIEARLTTIAARSLDMEKLQADLDAIKSENESLERKQHVPL